MKADYSSESHIATIKDVKSFLHHVVYDWEWIEFHPDDSFAQYRKFPADLVADYDHLLDECKSICKQAGADIYQMGLNEIRTYMVKHKL